MPLQDARATFRSLLSESTQQLGGLSKRLGSCIDKAKPYYDCRLKAKEVIYILCAWVIRDRIQIYMCHRYREIELFTYKVCGWMVRGLQDFFVVVYQQYMRTWLFGLPKIKTEALIAGGSIKLLPSFCFCLIRSHWQIILPVDERLMEFWLEKLLVSDTSLTSAVKGRWLYQAVASVVPSKRSICMELGVQVFISSELLVTFIVVVFCCCCVLHSCPSKTHGIWRCVIWSRQSAHDTFVW